MRYEDRQFSILLNEMPCRLGFRPSFLRVFLALHKLENAISGYTQPAQGVIARITGYCRKTVNVAVGWLRLNGFIKTLQRSRPIGDGRRWYQSLKYWVAKELGQVAFLEKIAKARRLAQWLNGEIRPKSPCNLGVTPPSRTESYSSILEAPKQRKNALEGVKRQC